MVPLRQMTPKESDDSPSRQVSVRVRVGDTVTVLSAAYGAILRNVLLENELSPYREANRWLNCHGMGICGTCQVVVVKPDLKERDRSCQIRCFRDLEIELE